MAKKRNFHDPYTNRKLVRNYTRGRTQPIQALAVHTTESHDYPGSTKDISSIWNWFDNPVSEASSHDILDGDGRDWRVVLQKDKAWTIGAANSFTLNYELVGFAAYDLRAWNKNMRMLKKLAQRIAYDATKYGIPIQRGKVANVGGACVCTKQGVITHNDVTKAGFGTHTDPGPAFPMAAVLRMAKWYKRHGWFDGVA